MKNLYILFFMFTIFAISNANTNDWVVKITADETNIVEIEVSDLQSEISNYAMMNGVNYDMMKEVLSTDVGLWQFVSQIIDLEVLYMQAKIDGYDKKENVITNINNELDKQIAQVYAPKVLDTNLLIVSDSEKRAFWNKEQGRIKGMYGNSLTYKDIENDIESNLMQEKMKKEYKNLIKKYQKEYKIEYSMNKNPCLIIEDFEVPKSEFDKTFEEALKNAGTAVIDERVKAQVKEDMFNTFVAQHIILYEAKKSNFADTEEGKYIDKIVKRSIITKMYIEEKIFSKIADSTDEEIEEAYNRFGKRYNVDSLSYDQAQVLLDSLVKQAKAEASQKAISTDLRYKYKIEKNLDVLKNSL